MSSGARSECTAGPTLDRIQRYNDRTQLALEPLRQRDNQRQRAAHSWTETLKVHFLRRLARPLHPASRSSAAKIGDILSASRLSSWWTSFYAYSPATSCTGHAT
eukprot:9470291-Pyramimonas_sp.AAC.1